VLDIDQQKRRISLGLKQCLDNPWESFEKDYKVGDELRGTIRNITEFGLFVVLPGDIDGMVHMSDLSWEKSSEEAMQDYNKGDEITVKILDIDVTKERISLGVKQLTDDPMKTAQDVIKKGDVVTCTVTDIQDKGIEVSIGVDGVTGFIRKSDLARDRGEQRPDRFAAGEKLDAKVLQFDKDARKVTLSVKAYETEEEKKAMASYGSSDSGASLGDILGAALKKAEENKDENNSGS